MLKELRIENFAIIHQLELKFEPGLTTFTGETGAGKSILLDAIEALIGGRAETGMIRSDVERANLEALFSMPPDHKQEIIQLLDSEGLYEGEPNILLNREIRREGRNIARINGRVVNVSLMKELGAYLVDIHGQSEHLSLLTVRQHLQLLDRFADDRAALDEYQQSYHVLKATQQELKDLRQAEQDAARMSDLLNYQIQEIDAAKLRVGEEDELREELSRLANAEKLSSLAKQAYSLLEEDSPETPAINSMLGQVVSAVRALANIDKSLEPLADQCENISSLSSDTSRDLQNYLEAIEYNPKRLEQTENRLALINTLKRKYGENEQAILDFAEKARLQLNRITNAEERIGELEALEAAQLAETARKALTLSEARKSAAAAMGGQVERELADLHMAGARFAVDMQFKAVESGLPLDDGSQVKFDERGIDQVEFLIAPNPGEGLKPLVKIASGGETSRLMLALKNVLAKADTIPTLIFDEIDQGIGGRIGAMVGEKLWQLGNRHQVLCVTHLPQLAAYGNHHYHVYKQVQDGRTMTKVEELTADRRRVELALMFGGDSEANQSAAQEALDSAEMRKKEFINLL
ncbi:MAG: DNA repair protein RecN [Anaerolineae bacterium]|nr:DNA repair protein RecN [Anaerolineae bacterium]